MLKSRRTASYGLEILEGLCNNQPNNQTLKDKLINTYIAFDDYDKALKLICGLSPKRLDDTALRFKILKCYLEGKLEKEKQYFQLLFKDDLKIPLHQNKTIYVNYFSGGLGNQLYYLAFANYLRSQGFVVKLLISQDSSIGDTSNPSQRNLLLDLPTKLGFNLHYESAKTIYKLSLIEESRIIGIYQEPKHACYHEIPSQLLNSYSSIIFKGYFQSHHYLNSSFIPRLQYAIAKLATTQRLIDYRITTSDVALHIRRGDFLIHNFFEFIDVSYYLNALARLNNFGRIFIFSDDFESIKKEIKILSESYQVICVQNQTVLEDFHLLMQFSQYVLGNSTFAWWGARISYNEAPTVIVPKYPWSISYGKSVNTSQYPPEWIQLDNTRRMFV